MPAHPCGPPPPTGIHRWVGVGVGREDPAGKSVTGLRHREVPEKSASTLLRPREGEGARRHADNLGSTCGWRRGGNGAQRGKIHLRRVQPGRGCTQSLPISKDLAPDLGTPFQLALRRGLVWSPHPSAWAESSVTAFLAKSPCNPAWHLNQLPPGTARGREAMG